MGMRHMKSTNLQMYLSDLGKEPSKVSPHVGEHFLLLGLIVRPLLGLLILFPLSLLLRKHLQLLLPFLLFE